MSLSASCCTFTASPGSPRQQLGVVLLQVRAAGGAQGQDVVVIGRVDGLEVLDGHFPCGFVFTHHLGRQAAAGLVHGVFQLHVVLCQKLHQSLRLFRVDKIHAGSRRTGPPGSRGSDTAGLMRSPQVAEGRFGRWPAGSGILLLGKEQGQMAQEVLPPARGFWAQRRPGAEGSGTACGSCSTRFSSRFLNGLLALDSPGSSR